MRVRQARPCAARRKRDGEPCGCFAIIGGTICRVHGGGAPQVRQAANRRLQDAQLRAAVHRLRAGVLDARFGPRWPTGSSGRWAS
jgi:hypothetical protein